MNFNPKDRQQLLLAIAIGVVTLFAGERLVFRPLLKSWDDRSARLTELKKKVAVGRQLLERENALQSRWDGMRTNALPVEASAAEQTLLGAFDRWSRQSGVSVSSLRPQWKRAGDDYLTLECRADAAGNLGALTRFLYEIEHDPMGVKVDSADLTTRDTDGQQITLGLQVSGLQLISKGP